MRLSRCKQIVMIGKALCLALLLSGLVFPLSSYAQQKGHFEAGGTSDEAAKQKMDDCMKRLNPKVAAMIDELISKTPSLATDPQAALGFWAMMKVESQFRNVAYGNEKRCPGMGLAQAYGYTQVTYEDFAAEVSQAMGRESKLAKMKKSDPGWRETFCSELATAAPWMMAHPGETFRLGAQEYITRLKQEKGDVMTALNKVCGGNDLSTNMDRCIKSAGGTGTYEGRIKQAIAELSQCTSDSGEGVDYGNYKPRADSGNTTSATPARPAEAFECQDVDLADALQKASAYFNAASAVASRTAADAATKAAREDWNKTGNVFDTVSNRICYDVIGNFESLIETLLGIAGTILNMLISFINQLLSLACQYVVAAISNVLNTICIPLPDLPNMPGFGGGPNRKSCNGLSMADMVSMSVHPVQITPQQLGIPEYQRAVRDKVIETVMQPFNRTKTSTPTTTDTTTDTTSDTTSDTSTSQ